MNTTVTKEEVFDLIAFYRDFDGDLQAWKDSFYELFRYQMTFDFAYKISAGETRKNGVFVEILAKPPYLERVLDAMKNLHYAKVDVSKTTVGIIDSYCFFDVFLDD